MADGAAVKKEGEVHVRELSVPAEEGQLSRVRDFIAEVCDESGFSQRETSNTKLAVDEACTNIIKHAYAGGRGEIKIRTEVRPGKIDIKLRDSGKKFDFASVQDPDLDQYVETGKKGGLGIFLINRLMDGVEYHSGSSGNELILSKSSHGAVARTLPGQISWRGSLRYKFTMRASLGLFVIIAAIGGYIFARQTSTLNEQRATQWIEKKRLAENVANKSAELLLRPEAFSIEQTRLATFVTKTIEGSDELAYLRVVDRNGDVLSSNNIDEIFSAYEAPQGQVLMEEGNGVRWMQVTLGGRPIRDIRYPVVIRSEDSGQELTVGNVYLGVYEDTMAQSVHDPRLVTSLIIVGCFIVGIMLIMGLVSVFVRPIQVLTDGVRAIGAGTMDGKIDVQGPAEIGAIASVFNEITEKFKKAQESVLEQEKLQKEIEVAKQIQQALLPKKHPDVSGYDIAPYYQAAKEVGGDYYDFVQVDDDTLGVVVADVSGKGVPGSLVMTMIRTALRMEARGNKNASDVMSKMNEFVTDDMKKGMFVTMFYIILDSKNRIISYASAGHNPMILYRSEANETYFLNPKGFPVGISLPDENLFRKSISLEKIKLKKDDMLLIYTDGVTEAMNERREQYGEDRLIGLVKEHGDQHPTEFIKILEADIKRFTGGYAQNDDITVVAIKEKLTADEVLFGIRKRLIEMVDVEGFSVKEACRKMKVSPTTYYRYKKRMEVMGERGLQNKVLREDVSLKRVSLEQRKELLAIIAAHPEFGAKRITEEYNKEKTASRRLTEKMVYDELRRLRLNTKELRLEYLRRNKLIPDEEEQVAESASRALVEDLIRDTTAPPVEPMPASTEDADADRRTFADDLIEEAAEALDEGEEEWVEGEAAPAAESVADDYAAKDAVTIASKSVDDDVTIVGVKGHLDSVSSTALERKLQEVIKGGGTKVVVDLAEVSYVSSGGWGIFVAEVRRLREHGGDVVLVAMSADVYDIYELLGFADIMRAFPSLDEARSYLRKPPEERLMTMPTAPEAPAVVEQAQDETYGAEWESLAIEATTVGDQGDTAVISLSGIIDTISAERLRAAIDRVITSGIYRIVVDMSQVEYVSSGGWGTFTERLRELRRNGGDIKLFGMDADVYYVFTMLGFNIVLSSFDVLTDAIEDFESGPSDRPSVHPYQTPSEDADQEAKPAAEEEAPRQENLSYLTHEGRAVDWRRRDGRWIASLHGTIDATSVEEIDEEVTARIESKPKTVLFDMSDVTYVSSAGWGLFAKYHERVVLWGGRIAIVGMNQGLYDIFRLLEFHAFIDVFPTVDAAVKALETGAAPRRDEASDETSPGHLEAQDIPASLFGRAEEPVHDEAEPASVDDILGAEPDAPAESAFAPEDARPLEKPLDDLFDDGAREGDDTSREAGQVADPYGEVTEEEHGRERFVDFDYEPAHVDVEASRTDARVGEDRRLRKMGWQAYGEKLRRARRNDRGKNGDEE